MKKLSLFLALILVLTCAVFAACGDETKKDNSDKTESTASETESTASGDASVADGEASGADDETSTDSETSTNGETSTPDAENSNDETSTPDDETNDEYMSFEMKCGDYIYVIKLLETESEEGVFEFYETSIASEEDLAMMGMSGSLSMSDITTFTATDIKTSETSIIITGAPTSVRSEFKGEAAETFKALYRSMFEGEDDPLSQLTLRLLDGEVLEGEDIDNYTYYIDQTIEVTLSVEGDALVLTELTRKYTSWGFMAPTEEVYNVENGVVRSVMTYENGELVYEDYYDENGEMIFDEDEEW